MASDSKAQRVMRRTALGRREDPEDDYQEHKDVTVERRAGNT